MRRLPLIVSAAAILAFALLVGPAIPDLATRFLGVEYTDHYGTQWFYWFAEQVTLGEQSPTWTDRQFHPYGKDIYRHTGANLLDALLAVPFRKVFGPVLGYNLFVIAGMVAAALSFRHLALVFTEDRVAAGLGAVFFACSPFLLYELQEGRPTQALAITLPLFLRYSWLTGIQPGWRSPVLAGIWLFVTGLWYWFYAFFGGLSVLVLGLVRTLRRRDDRGVFARHIAVAAIGVGACLPFALPLIVATSSLGPEVPGLLDISSWTWSQLTPVTAQGSSVGLFSWQPLTGWTGLYTIDGDLALFLPCHRLVSPAALLAIALWLRHPGKLDRLGWAALVLPCALFAAGPLLIVGQRYLINPWWAGWTAVVPFLRRLWWPSRAMIIPTIAVPLCLVVVFAKLGQRGRVPQILGSLAFGTLWAHHLAAQDLAPFPTWDATVPAGYRCLASGGDEALIELPYSWTQGHLYYQTWHGRPMLGGMLENNLIFTPPESVTLRSQNSFLQGIIDIASMEGEVTGWTAEDRAELRALDFAFVVFQKDAHADPDAPGQEKGATARRTHLRRMLAHLRDMLGEPIYNDARTTIFAPWGDPLPCDRDLLVPDRAPGPGQTLRHTILSLPDKEFLIRPFWGP
jgi:hypothetical protein